MPRAEVGSTKYLNNKLKSKGLQRLRWYCQVCSRQMRDENGFKMHTQSESHVRALLLVGEDPRRHIAGYSAQFQRDFVQLLRTAHGEKSVHLNHFYQEYIAHKEHVHMNATRWASLTEFARHLGREGVCRVEETEKGLHIRWVDNSPEALRRQDAVRRKERMDRGDEDRERAMIQEQVERAQRGKEEQEEQRQQQGEEGGGKKEEEKPPIQWGPGEKIKLSFGARTQPQAHEKNAISTLSPKVGQESGGAEGTGGNGGNDAITLTDSTSTSPPAPAKVNSKPKNVFAALARKPPLGGFKREPPKRPMSEAERIMREEIERKRKREARTQNDFSAKKQKML
ncbi:MAG: hypothetical protein LQ342_000703 [Letrouitia transgressa]|nr:MAG: hypothetical protein LQ342_000703 [Letrouitia transgressa]